MSHRLTAPQFSAVARLSGDPISEDAALPEYRLIALRRGTAEHRRDQLGDRPCNDLTDLGGLLIGKGGVFGNVLRIKPPMCIQREDCDFMCKVLDICLSEVG